VEADADGKVRVLVSSAEFGPGNKYGALPDAAEALGLPYESVAMRSRTDRVRTASHATAMIVGKLVSPGPREFQQTLTKTGLLKKSAHRNQFRPRAGKYIASTEG